MNKTMMSDLYEFTMSQSYFNENRGNEMVTFDAFFRKEPFKGAYAIMGGVDNILKYIKNLKFTEEDINYLRETGNNFTEEFLDYLRNFKFTGDIYMVPDGTPVFANEPLITVKTNIIEASIIETAVLSYLNACIKYTTAASHMTNAAGNIPIMEFGARRADGPDAANLASKCAVIAGCVATSNLQAAQMYDLKASGTMAHSMVTNAKVDSEEIKNKIVFNDNVSEKIKKEVINYETYREKEYRAFTTFAKTYPDNCVFLVDTYNVLDMGIPNAMRVSKELNIPLKGIRIDSGNLTELSIKARKILDENGFNYTKICVSNGLNPKTINELRENNAPIDSIGAGDNIACPKERVGVVYKLVGKNEFDKEIPEIKVSNDPGKTINPGYKKVYRLYDLDTNIAMGDVIVLNKEKINKNKYKLYSGKNENKIISLDNYRIEELQKHYIHNGKQILKDKTVLEKQQYYKEQMKTLPYDIKQYESNHKYRVGLSKELYELKKELIEGAKVQTEDIKKYYKAI